MKYVKGVPQRQTPLQKYGLAWIQRKYKVRHPRNVGGDKHSAGHPLIAECMSNYQTNE